MCFQYAHFESINFWRVCLISAHSLFCDYSLVVPIETAFANSVESDLGCTSRVYFDNVTLTSQKPCQYNNKFDCSETNGYNIPQDAINEV